MFDAQAARHGLGRGVLVFKGVDADNKGIDHIARVRGEEGEGVDLGTQIVQPVVVITYSGVYVAQ